MAISLHTAFGAIVASGLTLFAIGHPEAQPSPATPAKPSTVTAAGFTLTSLAVDLPNSDRTFPPGPGMEVTQQNCTACHSAGMVLNQPNLPASTWGAEVQKMLAVYKAPIDPADAPAIVAYLASIKGTR